MLRLSVVGLLTILVLAMALNQPASDTQNAIASDHVVQKVVSNNISFHEKGAVHGVTVDGCEFSSTGWEASDGAVVFLQIYYCKTPANAQAAWNRLTNDATKIFERKTLAKGSARTAERIVASFSKDLTKLPEVILWTDGDDIYMVESKSFEHALVFEKKYPNV